MDTCHATGQRRARRAPCTSYLCRDQMFSYHVANWAVPYERTIAGGTETSRTHHEFVRLGSGPLQLHPPLKALGVICCEQRLFLQRVPAGWGTREDLRDGVFTLWARQGAVVRAPRCSQAGVYQRVWSQSWFFVGLRLSTRLSSPMYFPCARWSSCTCGLLLSRRLHMQ